MKKFLHILFSVSLILMGIFSALPASAAAPYHSVCKETADQSNGDIAHPSVSEDHDIYAAAFDDDADDDDSDNDYSHETGIRYQSSFTIDFSIDKIVVSSYLYLKSTDNHLFTADLFLAIRSLRI